MTYTYTYKLYGIPFKYYKYYYPNINDTNFKNQLTEFIYYTYRNIINSNVSIKSKKKYIGILRNTYGIKQILNVLIINFNMGNLHREFCNTWARGDMREWDLLKQEIKNYCRLPKN